MVSDKGGRAGFVYKMRQRVYKALRREGKTKTEAAKIANAGNTRQERHVMGQKSARTRRLRYGGKNNNR
jgi:hypothetical protein